MEKKDEVGREWLRVNVSLGFLLVVIGEPNVYQNLGDFTRIYDFTWRVSDCEEIEGVTHKREWGREIIESK